MVLSSLGFLQPLSYLSDPVAQVQVAAVQLPDYLKGFHYFLILEKQR